MSKLVIRKRVTLEFLGDEYKDAYIDFKSIPVGDYDKLIGEIKGAGDADNSTANAVILRILKDYYIGGKFPDSEGKLEDLDGKDELDNLDKEAVIECFGKLTGQDLKKAAEDAAAAAAAGTESAGAEIDPKLKAPSKPGSTTANQPPSK
jgi:hypothetical protein